MFKKKFILACKEFKTAMGASVPEWFIAYLEKRSDIEPVSHRSSIKVAEWSGHPLGEIEAYLHALHISPAGMLFNSILSKKTGYVMAHLCGCDDCFRPGTVDVDFPDMKAVQDDFVAHVEQQKRQMGIAA